ncbi:MAG: NADH-quinone oxidoreductase subunit NuoE [Ignavibacteria bacterium]|jgi:NADH-quinone oxidoreductase E subunit|nr:NADH-quinone oxidoreductase subunit NuoE [Ignavibacteria bacterium]MCU7503935.1 NADH-quinone oxidoreductase subunit NuoE [Ignavibacteria bacterium]MCU7515844.1 NADH-quinone oxidoreductase subunit NuoE [Ignavibacteria bacterium]
MDFKFTEENLSRIESVRKKYPDSKAALMPVLYIAQEQNGYITREVMDEVALVLGIKAVDVLGVATFYTMYHTSPVGKYHLQVCTNVSCMLKGGYEMLEETVKKLGIGVNEVTPDGKFSIEEVECMGSCGTAPMMAVNNDYFENLTKEKLNEILDSLK